MPQALSAAVAQQAEEAYEEVMLRFLFALPDEDWASFERIFFHIETGWWFYEDNYREQNPALPKHNLKSFAAQLFRLTPQLEQYEGQLDELYEQFNAYKFSVPVCGAIVMDASMESCMLVKGCSKQATWGFPKGKIGKDETQLACAIREVWEEIGYDITTLVTESEYVEVAGKSIGHPCRLFFAAGAPAGSFVEGKKGSGKGAAGAKGGFAYHPHMAGEISEIKFVRISELLQKAQKGRPTSSAVRIGDVKHRMFLVAPVVNQLRAWIAQQKGQAPDSVAALRKKGAGQAKGSKARRKREKQAANAAAQPKQRQQQSAAAAPLAGSASDLLSMLGGGIAPGDTPVEGAGSSVLGMLGGGAGGGAQEPEEVPDDEDEDDEGGEGGEEEEPEFSDGDDEEEEEMVATVVSGGRETLLGMLGMGPAAAPAASTALQQARREAGLGSVSLQQARAEHSRVPSSGGGCSGAGAGPLATDVLASSFASAQPAAAASGGQWQSTDVANLFTAFKLDRADVMKGV